MNEPQPDLPAELASRDGAEATAVETAFDQPSALPFFDLDIALIRRGQSKPHLQTQTAAAPEFNRERKALDALEALLAERALARPKGLQTAPVPLFPQTVLNKAEIALKYIEPRIVPVPHSAEISTGFVSPAFERAAAPNATVNEPRAALAITFLQTASDVAAQAADLLPDLKLQLVRQALTRREAIVLKAQRAAEIKNVQAAWRPAPQTAAAVKVTPQATTNADADDLPWGHVTYRLLVM